MIYKTGESAAGM